MIDPVVGQLITAGISGGVTLLVAMGTWHFQMKAANEKQAEEFRALINEYRDGNKQLIDDYRDEIRGDINDLQEEVTKVNATVQQQVAIVEVRIEELSSHVEKHNQVIERTYALEKTSAVHDEKIRHLEEIAK